MEGKAIDPARLEQGTDFKVRASVRNTGVRGDYEEVALSQVFASGFEIHNERLDPARRPPGGPIEYQDVRDDLVLSYFDLKAGETKTIEIASDDAYGPVQEEARQDVPRAQIPAEIPLEVGIQLQMQSPTGQVVPVTVVEITEEAVTLDANHPLAGKDLTFALELVSIG
ncbi:MAG: hypothetical protein OQK00_04375 [Rhodobacteraceae bacterium]|nr:hypothetical protein [Paracoccaceae bacterium]